MRQSQPTRLWFPRLARHAVDWFADALPMVYLAWALPLLLMLAVATPPWQNPGETTQMLRISQIADGGLVAYRFGNLSGGVADEALFRSFDPMNSVTDHGGQVSLGMLAKAGLAHWGTPKELHFPLTAPYPPFLFAPAVLAVEVGRVLRLSVVHSLIAVRMATAITSALVAALALSLARRTRLALAVLLVLPMTESLFAAAGQDALMIALTLVVVACVDRVSTEERDPTFWESVLIGAATAVVIMARPPYLPMAALPLFCMRVLRRQAWINFAAIVAVSVGWLGYTATRVSLPLLPGVNPAAQLIYILHQPWAILPIAINTLVQGHVNDTISFIGVLGQLVVFLPDWYYDAARFVLLLAFVSAAAGPPRRTWVALLICLAAVGSVFFAEYLIWTVPHADYVSGIQGRYFIPLAAVLAMAVPAAWRRLGEALQAPALVAIVGLAMITPMVIVHATILHYYLVP